MTIAPLVNGAGQCGSFLVTDGWGDKRPKRGDRLQIHGVTVVYGAEPAVFEISRVTSDRLGGVVLKVTPPILKGVSVDRLPHDNEALTVLEA